MSPSIQGGDRLHATPQTAVAAPTNSNNEEEEALAAAIAASLDEAGGGSQPASKRAKGNSGNPIVGAAAMRWTTQTSSVAGPSTGGAYLSADTASTAPLALPVSMKSAL
jgi:hypothetical protein